MNKVNTVWVFSDGRKGHEIQSLSLAEHLGKNIQCHRFSLNFTQKLIAPRPHKTQKILWKKQAPNLHNPPQIIISCGRQAAAVGRAFKKKLNAKHLQILNPKGNLSVYDVLLLPEHDNIKPPNGLQFTGSLHNISRPYLDRQTFDLDYQKPLLAVFLGAPDNRYWQQQWIKDWQKIKQNFNDYQKIICGSPRLKAEAKNIIKKVADNTQIWLSEQDGANPYPQLLSQADKFFVTADSINMVNESLCTQQAVSLLANQKQGSRHRRFINSISPYLTDFSQKQAQKNKLNNPIEELLPKLQQAIGIK